jgi:hypothetical protein
MSSMEGLGDIGRGKFDNHLLLAFGGVCGVLQTRVLILAILLFSGEDRGDENLCEFVCLKEELEECIINDFGFLDEG